MRLVRGRYFNERDSLGAPRVIIVDERVARKFWPGKNPIGRRMYVPSGADVMKRDERLWLTVAGVVGSARLQNLAGTGNSAGAFYFPYAQNPGRGYTFAIRAGTGAAALAGAMRKALASVDPSLALFDLKTMAERTELSLSSKRVAMSLALAFSALALFLAALGIYTVLAYLLARRRREIGIRIAVGSTQAGIFRLFLYEGLALVGGGLVLGIVGAAGLQKVMDNHIYGIHPLDPTVLAGVVSVLGAVALAACLWPARQAMRVDPMIVLSDQ